jgi:hypothetical protein
MGYGEGIGRKAKTSSPSSCVDSLAPARSTLRVFGSAEFLSLLPKQLKSPPRRRNRQRCRGLFDGEFWLSNLTTRVVIQRQSVIGTIH